MMPMMLTPKIEAQPTQTAGAETKSLFRCRVHSAGARAANWFPFHLASFYFHSVGRCEEEKKREKKKKENLKKVGSTAPPPEQSEEGSE